MLIKWTDQNLEDWINGISLIVYALTQDTHTRINKYVWFWYVVLIHRFLGIGNINTFSLNKIGFLRTQLKWWPPFRKANIFINFRCVQIGRFYFPTYVFQWHIVWRNPHTERKVNQRWSIWWNGKGNTSRLNGSSVCVGNFYNSINKLWNLHAYASLHFYSVGSISILYTFYVDKWMPREWNGEKT